jgi:hypothetical protein
MLDKLNDILSKTACFLMGHQYYRTPYNGKVGYYYAGKLGAQARPVMDRVAVNLCHRCGKQLGPVDDLDKSEKYRGL